MKLMPYEEDKLQALDPEEEDPRKKKQKN